MCYEKKGVLMNSTMVSNKEIRVLHVVPTLDVESGVASFVVNHQREIRKYGINFDYVYHFSNGKNYLEEVRSLGSRIYSFPAFSIRNAFGIWRDAEKLMKKNKDFSIVHCGQSNAAFLYAPLAKKFGIPFIQHSHSAGATSDSKVNDFRNRILISIADRYVTDRFACSVAAGKALFGNKRFFLASNGIDGSKFMFSQRSRAIVRKELGLEGKFVLACVGRMADQKNQKFLIDAFPLIEKNCPDAVLVFVGSGVNDAQIRYEASKLDSSRRIIFLGSRDDVSRLYSAFDLLLMPSLYEGLPVAGIEAQFSGLNVIFSDRITRESSLLPGNEFLPLSDIKAWATSIKRKHVDWESGVLSRGVDASCEYYDIHNSAKRLAEAYYRIAARG